MPARGDRSVPTFDPSKPRELKRYFSELEYLFSDASIEAGKEKKSYTVRYVSFDVADIWETLPEFSDETKTYEDFKKAIQELYPDSNEEYKYSLADMDLLVGRRHRMGMETLADLAEYHSQFLAITTFLIKKKCLSDIEQKRAYVRGFPPALWAKVSQRLQLKNLDHLPDEPYEISEVQAAARFVLHGTTSSSATNLTPPASTSSSSTSPSLDVVVKPEQLGSLFTEFTKSIIDAINNSQNRARPPQPTSSASTSNRDLRCNFCGKDHFIRNCELVEEYRRAGKVKRNTEGKVVLPTGAFVPRDIPGTLLKERIDEWHRRNPGQLATATISASTMLNTIAPASVSSVPSTTSSSTSSDRIALLEAELFSLRAQRPGFTPTIRTRAQKARAPIAEEDKEISSQDPSSESTQPAPSKERSPPPQQRGDAQDSSSTSPNVPSINDEPEHPFRDARDANYLPPQHRNVAAPSKPAPKKAEPAYRNQAPIHDDSIANNIFHRSLDTPITLTQRELLSIAPDVRTQYKDVTTAKRNVTSGAMVP
ncbi:hypothetical protein CPC08DRAFT_806142 [Agrocybe pediades]|nr:hypothetical protein CPC08DRAFT_806142 [Agrocybe pediades]